MLFLLASDKRAAKLKENNCLVIQLKANNSNKINAPTTNKQIKSCKKEKYHKKSDAQPLDFKCSFAASLIAGL
jgi:hypothetical protein